MPANRQNNKSQDAFVETRSPTRRYLLPMLLVVTVLVAFFLPVIIAKSPLKQTVLEFAASDVNGDVEIGDVSVGWFSPIVLKDVRVISTDHHEVVTVATVRTTQSLFALLTSSEYGSVQLTEPTVDILVRPDGSNLEDVFASYLEPAANDETMSLPRMQIQIVDGAARIRSTTLAQTGTFQAINANLSLMGQDSPLSGELQFQCSSNESNTGNVAFQFSIDKGAQQFKSENIAVSIQADQMPLDALATGLTRVLGPANCTGILNAELNLNIDSVNRQIEANIETFNGRQIAVVAPDFLGQDQFVARSIDVSGSIAFSSTAATANQFKAETEFARLSADGEFDFEQLSQLSSEAEIPDTEFQLDGVVDLAQLVSMLPATTHIRDGVKMKTGLLNVTAGTRTENGSPRLVVNAEAANVNFDLDQQNIIWNQPLRAVAVAGKTDDQLTLHDIQLKSDFLNISGNASLQQGSLKIVGDLKKVMNQLGQVLELGGMQLGGIASGELAWNVDAEKNTIAAVEIPVDLKGNFTIANPSIRIPGTNPWSESSIDIKLNSALSANTQTANIAINAGHVEMQIGAETLVADLALPIANLAADWKYQMNCEASGSISKWLAQARNLAEFPEFACDGKLESRFLLTMNPQAFRLNQIQFQASNFAFDGFALSIREPKVSGRVNLKYQFDDGSLLFTKSKVTSPAVAISTDQLLFKTAEKLLADGAVVFRGNANRASQWIGFSMPGDAVRWDGIANGTMTFNSESGKFGGSLSAKAKDLVFVQPTSVLQQGGNVQQVSQQRNYAEFWKEPEARLTTKLALSDDFNSLILRNTSLKSKTADIQLSGTIKDLATTMAANLNGRWSINWDGLNQTLQELIGEVVVFKGAGWQPLKIQGPLYDASGDYAWIPNKLGGRATLKWQQATLLGVSLGTSTVDIQLNQSLARFSSQNNTSLVDQVFQMQPIMDLRQADPIVYLQEGKLLEAWNVSVADSRSWLKYAAPLVADATAAQGQISANLKGATIPIFDPMQASAEGELIIQNLNIGPGPLAQQLIPMIDQIKSILKPGSSQINQQSTWLKLKPQRLPFVVQDGRVFHDGFEMQYKDFTVRTRGSVGFDQSLNMTAQIPIAEEWVKGDKVLSRLIGKSISIPVAGTLSKPQLDRRAVVQATTQLLRQTAMGAVNDKINSEVGEIQQKFTGKVQGELNQLQNNLNDKLKNQFEDKVQGELRNGLNKLFGGDKK